MWRYDRSGGIPPRWGETVNPGNRLTKSQRLLKRAQFLDLSKKGKKIQNRHFIVLVAATDGPCSRLGITASKRVGNAVVRNRIKRHCREVFRRCCLGFSRPVDVSIIAKREAAPLDGPALQGSLKQLIDRHRGVIF